MSSINSSKPSIPFYAISNSDLVGGALPILTANGGSSSAVITDIIYNQNITKIIIASYVAAALITAPTLLRATIFQKLPSSAPQQLFPVGYCDALIPAGGAATRMSIIMQMISITSPSNATINSIDNVLFNAASLSSVPSMTTPGLVSQTITNGQIVSASANVLIPNQFRILLQNMDSVNNLNLPNTNIYFS